jgi:uncharacterized protein (TIGR01244 family)
MIRSQAFVRLAVAAAFVTGATIGALTCPTPVLAQPAGREAPFGDRAGSLAVNYTRIKPHIATAGVLKNGAAQGLKALGFATIVDLRGPDEGAAFEKTIVEEAGLRYVNIPVTSGAPTEAQIAEFARIVEDARNAPLLVHCVTANRVGAMWALYRAQKGIPVLIALEEGRTIGLQPDREAELRKRLEQPSSAR